MLSALLFSFLFTNGHCRLPKFSGADVPSISNSLVNLGKVDVSFFINTKGPRSQIKQTSDFHDISDAFLTPPANNGCPCSKSKPFMSDLQSNFPEFINKIIKSNEFLSFKEPMSSSICCDEIREETIIFDIPKSNLNNQRSMPFLPLSIVRPELPKFPPKLSPIEIVFYPKKNDHFKNAKEQKNDILGKKVKPEIKIVGDQMLENEFDTLKYLPRADTKMSVKKDLNQEVRDVKETLKPTPDAVDVSPDNTNTV